MVNQDPWQWLPQKEDAQRGGKIAYNRQTSGKNGTGKCATQQDRGPCRVEPWCPHQFNAKNVNYNHQVPTDQVSQQSHQWMAWVRTTHRNSCWNFLATPGCQPKKKTYSILAHHPTSSPRQKNPWVLRPPEPCTAEFPTSATDGVGWMFPTRLPAAANVSWGICTTSLRSVDLAKTSSSKGARRQQLKDIFSIWNTHTKRYDMSHDISRFML